MPSGFRFLDHMTDAVIEAHGQTMEEAFEQAARGLHHTMIGLESVRPVENVTIEATGHDLFSLLFDWLDKVMLLLVADRMVLSEFHVQISESGIYTLKAQAKGEKLDLSRHKYKVEIKAVTYHEMAIVKEQSGVTVRFLLDL